MKYIVAPKSKALDMGIRINGHRCSESSVILNEREVLECRRLPDGDLAAKARAIGGKIYTDSAIKQILKDYE